MPIITLPDGNQRQFEQAVTVLQVAVDIGPGLAKAALAGRANGHLVDTSFLIEGDSELSIITNRDEESLAIIRHSCAHLMAQAVKILFPETQVTIGPVIDDGFFYDFARPEPFTPEDLEKIEAKMQELVKADLPVTRSIMSRPEAVKYFRDMGEEYKAEIIESIATDEVLSIYTQGDFADLCRGPHVPNTGKLKAFKLTKLAGAYWRGDSNNEMLQRIYGTAWPDKKSLRAYLERLQQAEKRDHRKLGKKLDLFHFQPEAPGMVFWHEKGWLIHQLLEQYIRDLLQLFGYQEVRTPQIIDRSLWEKSGHWDKFADHMFTTNSEHREYAIKPMNCPAHVQLFNQGLKSYRDLPLRIAEFGMLHRNEASGTLHGLMRARCFTQDDAHIFCAEDQLQEEVGTLINLTMQLYRDFGFNQILTAVSTRPEARVGSSAQWDRAEDALKVALDNKQLDWKLQSGEGAFYGPKIEFILQDSIGRAWQCGTIQVDFSMPARLNASYIAKDGSKQIPIMVHRAILGSVERFIGILLEHYAGALPVWLVPVQVVVNSLTEKQADFALQIVKNLKKQGIRADSDLRDETIGFKIREHSVQRVPYQLVIGAREVANNLVAVRTRDGKNLGTMALVDFITRLKRDTMCPGLTAVEE